MKAVVHMQALASATRASGEPVPVSPAKTLVVDCEVMDVERDHRAATKTRAA
jgi:hypothetical protein